MVTRLVNLWYTCFMIRFGFEVFLLPWQFFALLLIAICYILQSLVQIIATVLTTKFDEFTTGIREVGFSVFWTEEECND